MSDLSAQGINVPKMILLSALCLLALALFSGKFQCSFPRVLDVTLPRSQPDPGNGCDKNMRLDQFSKNFSQPNVVNQILSNFMKSKLGNSRRVFTLEELLVAVRVNGVLTTEFLEFLAKSPGIGIGLLTEIFDTLVTCGNIKNPKKPDFGEMIKKFKKPLPKFKPKTPAKTPKFPKGNGTDNLDDFHMW